MKSIEQLKAFLTPTRDSDFKYVGQAEDPGWGHVYGGLFLAQGFGAAYQTVDMTYRLHSLNAHFLQPGRVNAAIEYRVSSLLDGRSFHVRHVIARQGKQTVFSATYSFQCIEDGLVLQNSQMPTSVPSMKTVPTVIELRRELQKKVSFKLHAQLLSNQPINVRPVSPVNPLDPEPLSAEQQVWYECARLGVDDHYGQTLFLVYASDFSFLPTAMRPFGISWLTPGVKVTSLSHQLWLHRPFSLADGVLHAMKASNVNRGRALVRGEIFSADGSLIASSAQEGLLRFRG